VNEADGGAVSFREFTRRVPGATLGALARLAAAGKLPQNSSKALRWPEARDAWLAEKAAEVESRVADADLDDAIQRATLRIKIAQAEARELENATALRRLIPIDEVEEDAIACAEAIRATLLSLPQRVALQLESVAQGPAHLRAPQIEALLADEINAALTALHSTRFGQEAAR
jgi:phage terminase Nu1 subunit (DNA packaging protein)